MSARSPRMMQMSCGLKRSEHSGQLMLTRDSEISMRRYWRRQSIQERWWQVMMSGKLSLEWCRRHRGHSRSSGPTTAPTLVEDEVDEEAPAADEVEAAAAAAAAEATPVPAAETKAEFLSLHISEWMLSMLAMPSTPPSPPGPGCWSSRDLCRPGLCSRLRRLNKEARERRLFLGAFFTEGREMEEAVDWRSRSEPITPLFPLPNCWCFCRLISPEEGKGCASGEPGLGNLSLTCGWKSGSGTGLGVGVRWWMGEEEDGPGWGERAPEGPSVFKTWWLLLINLVVTSISLILAKGWGSLAVKKEQQNLEREHHFLLLLSVRCLWHWKLNKKQCCLKC